MAPGTGAGVEKAIRFPSGDHTGWLASWGRAVNCRTPVPLAFITQISNVPRRLLANAILLPSGDQAASPFLSDGDAVRFLSVLPSAFIT